MWMMDGCLLNTPLPNHSRPILHHSNRLAAAPCAFHFPRPSSSSSRTPHQPLQAAASPAAAKPAASLEKHSHQGKLEDGRSDEGSRGRLAGVGTGSAAAPSVRRRYIHIYIYCPPTPILGKCCSPAGRCIVKLFATGRPCYSQSRISQSHSSCPQCPCRRSQVAASAPPPPALPFCF
jgi:hypothetical protein